jgi:hypothetical protein
MVRMQAQATRVRRRTELVQRSVFREWAALLAALLLSSGCVERRMTIRSDPPGALVEVDGEPIGFSPASMSFTYYAPRKIKLIHDQYETMTVIQEVPPPWWDNIFTEFFTENLWPWTLRDEREFFYVLEPRRPHTTEEVLQRAQETRQAAQAGAPLDAARP